VIQGPSVDWWAIAPEITLLAGAAIILLLVAFVRGRDRGFGIGLGIAAFALSGLFAVLAWNDDPVITVANALQVDQLTQAVRVLIAGCGILSLLVVLGWNRVRENGAEFAALLLFAAAGMNMIAGSNSFITLFVALELFSIALYILCGFDLRSRASLEAAFKYLVLGTVGSIVLVYGAAFLYGATGSFDFGSIDASLQEGGTGEGIVLLGTGLVLIGLLFKIGSMPFHMWVPDVYEGAPTGVTGFMAAGTKIAAFIALARVLQDALPAMRDTWLPVLIVVAIVTMLAGNIAALVQTNIKRMLAYSSVSAGGFGLIAIIIGGDDGSRALIFYLAAYAPIAIGAFAVVSLHERDHGGISTLETIRGWGFDRRLASLAMVVFLLAFAGFPPTVGFIGKFLIAGAAITEGYVYLAIIAVIASVIGLGYYLRVILAMYDRSRKSGVLLPGVPGLVSVNVAIVLCLVLVLVGGVLPGLGVDWAGDAARALAGGR